MAKELLTEAVQIALNGRDRCLSTYDLAIADLMLGDSKRALEGLFACANMLAEFDTDHDDVLCLIVPEITQEGLKFREIDHPRLKNTILQVREILESGMEQ